MILFPCRLDPINVGHIVQIAKLLGMGYELTVDIFNYKYRTMPLEEAKHILKLVFGDSIRIATHDYSYTKKIPEYVRTEYRYVVTGNVALIDVFNNENVSHRYLPRYKGYRSSKMRDMFIQDRMSEN